MNELEATGRAIALDVRAAWVVALRADLKKTFRSILKGLKARTDWLQRVDVQAW